jgi:hypothetical protein
MNDTSHAVRQFANPAGKCFNRNIETGVLHEVGLRNTLEPDPDNTGVGSFRNESHLIRKSEPALSCFFKF